MAKTLKPNMPASVPTRPLGRNGPQIPALGLGLMGLSSKPRTIDGQDERATYT